MQQDKANNHIKHNMNVIRKILMLLLVIGFLDNASIDQPQYLQLRLQIKFLRNLIRYSNLSTKKVVKIEITPQIGLLE